MNTPIYDFVKQYAESNAVRMHMPGHKGHMLLGTEHIDITEIHGADCLYSSNGIIKQSERNASMLFGTGATFYSAEGSTLAIKAMLFLATQSGRRGERGVVLAARNVHKSFIHAAALLDLDVKWMYPEQFRHICSAVISARDVDNALSKSDEVDAVYITTPDYLGNLADVKGISEVCKKHKVPLLVDNAHGAYLRFLTPSLHPMDLGADMCADSAHKTLPVLTGGAYLHIAKSKEKYIERAQSALSLFASTSPSYLILSSLDFCNGYLADGFHEKLESTIQSVSKLREKIRSHGVGILESEPLKIVLSPNGFGYTGREIADALRAFSIECEFADEEYCVLMPSPENTASDYERIGEAIESLERKNTIHKRQQLFAYIEPKTAISIREAVFSPSKTVLVRDAIGQIASVPAVSCPPAVPIVVSGEYITEEAISLIEAYGIEKIDIVGR